MARIYGDEDFDHLVLELLRHLGHDVLTVQDAGNGNLAIPDGEVLAFAIREARIVITFNRRDFIHLHSRYPEHRGIIVCTRDPDVDALAVRIHEAIANCPDPDNQLLRVNRAHRL